MPVPNLSHIHHLTDEELKKSVRNFMNLWSEEKNLYLFCYGSLLWKKEKNMRYIGKAKIKGYQRDLCVWSVSHRGTPQFPGLVLGLVHGGFCEGGVMKFEGDRESNLFQLWKREMVTGLYLPRILESDCEGKSLKVLTFVVDSKHPQFASSLTKTEKISVVQKAAGKSGTNCSYLLNTVALLDKIGIDDSRLRELAAEFKAK